MMKPHRQNGLLRLFLSGYSKYSDYNSIYFKYHNKVFLRQIQLGMALKREVDDFPQHPDLPRGYKRLAYTFKSGVAVSRQAGFRGRFKALVMDAVRAVKH